MAKKKLGTTITLSSFDADLDSVLSSLEGPEEAAAATPDATEKPALEQPAAVTPPPTPPPVTPPQQERERPRATKSLPGKKKANRSPAGDPEVAGKLPPSSFTREELDWFFAQSVDTSELKRLYVPESTKEVLQLVARSAKIPLSHLTDNILRWFMVANREEIRKIIARHRNSLDRL